MRYLGVIGERERELHPFKLKLIQKQSYGTLKKEELKTSSCRLQKIQECDSW